MIVLDTHILIWWIGGSDKLTLKAANEIDRHLAKENSILISSISAWEIAMLVEKGRLTLSMDVDSWLTHVAKVPAVKFVPVDNVIAVKSVSLPGEFHKDPADRLIVSLARSGSYSLITADEKILNYKHVKTIN